MQAIRLDAALSADGEVCSAIGSIIAMTNICSTIAETTNHWFNQLLRQQTVLHRVDPLAFESSCFSRRAPLKEASNWP